MVSHSGFRVQGYRKKAPVWPATDFVAVKQGFPGTRLLALCGVCRRLACLGFTCNRKDLPL